MINLLPVSEKQKIKKIYHLRIIAVSLAFVAVLIAVSIAMIIPSYFSASVKYDGLLSAQSSEDNNISSHSVELEKLIAYENKKISILVPKTADIPQPRRVFSQILAVKGNNIRISQILWNTEAASKNENGLIRISIHGISSGREDIISFVNALKSNKLFTSVDFPISNFAKESNIEFTVDIIISIPTAT